MKLKGAQDQVALGHTFQKICPVYLAILHPNRYRYLGCNFRVVLIQVKNGVALPAGFPPHHWQHCSHLVENKVFLPDFPPTKNCLPPKIMYLPPFNFYK